MKRLRFRNKYVRMALGQPGGQAAILVLFLLVLYLFGYRHLRFFLVPSASMEPTLMTGDYIVTLNEDHYERGDIVVLRDPEDPGSYVVKRVVALGGDTVAMDGGALYVNGQYVSEPYVMNPAAYELESTKVPEGHALLLGDNRNNSEDSHLWRQKTQPVATIIGKVRFLYYPYDRAGRVRGYRPVTANPAVLQQKAAAM